MKSKTLVPLVFFPLFTFLVLTSQSIAQPPAQGPPPPPLPGVTTHGLGTYLIINQLKINIQSTLEKVNRSIDSQSATTGVRANIGFTYKLYQPGMAITTSINRPNQNMVRMSFSIEYSITGIHYHGVPYFARKIYQNITANITCKNWFNPPGQLNVAVAVDKPFLDDASFAEQALNFFIGNTLTNLLDSKLRQTLPGAFSTSSIVANTPCSCLGIDLGTAPNYTDGEIKYAYKKSLKVVGGGSTAMNTLTITLKSIKRLPAQEFGGGILYAVSEDIQIEFYGNQDLRVASVSQIKENEERALNVQPITAPKPSDAGMVVLIANITQQSNYKEDSRFAVFKKNQNFGNGTQKLIVQKTYWTKPQRLPGGGMSKPVEARVNAYELTVQISGGTAPVILMSN